MCDHSNIINVVIVIIIIITAIIMLAWSVWGEQDWSALQCRRKKEVPVWVVQHSQPLL
jgi:lipopolysaccharide export system protein LptC